MKACDLFIVRHAKSSWSDEFASDFDRPLAKRGKKSLSAITDWLESQHIKPDLLISSPAKRAKQTSEAIIKKLHIPEQNISFDKRLYLAAADTLLEILTEVAHVPSHPESVMLVGHNPGLEELVTLLCADPLPYTEDGKLLTTGNIVQLRFQQSWNDLRPKQGRLINFLRPKELD
ncbi:MAG: histidine phosphatase family protein [Gammaproteobacteria bacterium]|nr:histidine phosphatase family protein [Gammaproteobacteria bacterium]